jgi:hypothetical protein
MKHLLGGLCIALCATVPASASGGYSFTEILIPNPYGVFSVAPADINNSGQVTGSFSDGNGQYGFLYSKWS